MAHRCLTILLLGATCYILAIATGIGWLYLFAALIWGLGLLSAILAWLSLQGMEVSRELLWVGSSREDSRGEGIFEDDEVEVGLNFRNQGLLPKYFCRVIEQCPLENPNQAKHFFFSYLGHKSACRFAYRVRCSRRGEFSFPPVLVESGDIFGFFSTRRTLPAPLSLVVYPGYYPLSGPLTDGFTNTGHSLKVRAGTLVCGSREYQLGDPLKHVHWRNTARWSRLMVKEFEEMRAGSLIITFDARSSFGEGRESTLEYAVKIAASLAKYYATQGIKFYLLPGRGLTPSPLSDSLEFLARVKPGGITNLEELLQLARIPYPTLLIVSLADPLAPEIVERLSRRASSLTIVALAEFGSSELPLDLLFRVTSQRTTFISCPQGKLEETIRKIGLSLLGGLR